MGSGPILGWLVGLSLAAAACSGVPKKPCTQGGQSARNPAAGGPPFRGTKTCYQRQNESGEWVNDGKYFERHLNEKYAVTGEYKMGKKTGRWVEFDESGKKISDQYFENGKEVSAP